MAAVALRCQRPGCGREFIASRSDRRCCSERCKKALQRVERREDHESEIDDAIERTAYPEDALVVVLFRLSTTRLSSRVAA